MKPDSFAEAGKRWGRCTTDTIEAAIATRAGEAESNNIAGWFVFVKKRNPAFHGHGNAVLTRFIAKRYRNEAIFHE